MVHAPGSSARPDWPLAAIFGAGGLGMAVARQLGLSHRLLIADKNPEHLEAQIARLTDAGHDAAGLACLYRGSGTEDNGEIIKTPSIRENRSP